MSEGFTQVNGTRVYGVDVDDMTRCRHYHGDNDIVSIRFKCCDRYYPCHQCHEAVSGHEPRKWALSEHSELAILCGACGAELTIEEYLGCEFRCPRCGAGFNPGCKDHYGLYFESVDSPCIKVCSLNGAGVCTGCGRTIDEISTWLEMTSEERRDIMRRLSLS